MSVAQAKTYKWVDTEGEIHYSDQPLPASIKKVEGKNLVKNTIDVSELPYSM